MSGPEWQILAFVVALLTGVMLVVMAIVPFPAGSRGSVIPGSLSIRGRQYPYELGDLILRYDGATVFSGIDVRLPKRLPHIFLDALSNNKPVTPPEFVFERDNLVSLEGDFDAHFRAYAPAAHKVLALSILSPDVLHTLMRTSHTFDVEIIEDHVRLITRVKLVSRNEKLQDELRAAATAVMLEIDHRLQSWQESSLTGDTALDVRSVNKYFKQ